MFVLLWQTETGICHVGTARSGNDAGQPIWLIFRQVLIKIIHLRITESLQGNPDTGFGMGDFQFRGDGFQEGHYVLRMIVARITPGEKYAVELRTFFIEFGMLANFFLEFHGVRQIHIARGPHPIVESVILTDLGHF